MENRWGQNGAQVGALLVVFAILLAFGLQFLGFRVGEKHIFYHILLDNASGVNRGAPVAMAGVKVGTIHEIKLDQYKVADLTVQMEPGFKVPDGSHAEIPTSLIGLGETQINIIAPAIPGAELPDGATIPGKHLDPIGSLLPEGKATVNELTATLRAARNLLEGGLGTSIQATMLSAKSLLTKFGGVADQLQGLVAANKAGLSKAVASGSAAMENIQKATSLAYKLLKTGKFDTQIAGLMKSLTATSEKAGLLVSDMSKFVNDQGTRQSISATLANTAELTNQGKDIAKSFKVIAGNGEQVSAQAITLTQKATEVAEEAKQLLAKLEALSDKFGKRIESIPTPKNPIGTITSEGTLVHEVGPSYSRIDYNFMIPFNKENVYLGVFDAFESNQLNLQLSRPLFPGTVFRYGAYAGKPGVGVDYALAPKLGIRGDLFDINNPRFDLRAKYLFGSGFVGWLGYDRLWLKNNLTFGIGFEK